MPTGTTTVAVIGGGLAGLVAARRLADTGHDVRLFERRDEVGGRVRTLRRDGYTLDRGFQVLFTDYPAVRRELELDSLDLRRFAPGAWLARPGTRTLLADPLRDPRTLTDTLFNDEITVRDKLAVLRLRRELTRTPYDEVFDASPRSIREFLDARGFSARFIERFAAPFYGGITLDRALSTDSRVFAYTFKALSSGSAAVPAAGMGAISDQLADGARTAGVRIETGRTVSRIEAGDWGVEIHLGGETVRVDAAVVATDPPTARELTGVESIPIDGRGCVTQFYSLRAPELDAGNRLLLNVEGTAPNQIVPHSAVAPEHAPDGEVLLSATFLGTPTADDDELADRTRETLESWYPERSVDELRVVHTERIPFAQFDQPPGVFERLPDPRRPAGPVYLAGEYTRWSSIQGALESGRIAADYVERDR